MNIRSAKVEDALEIQELVFSLSHFYLENKNTSLPKWFSDTLMLSKFEYRLSNEKFENFVFTENDEIIGYISIKNTNHIYHLFVAESHHEKGISKKLWQFVISIHKMHIYTVRSSIFAVPIYQSFGFKVIDAESHRDGLIFQAMELIISE